MSDLNKGKNPYKMYWVNWFILLVITLAMLGAESLHMSRWLLVPFLLVFMMVKATMISGSFMHLRFEHRRLWMMVLLGLLLTSVTLFIGLTPETYNVLARTPAP
jgi:cytochrome c oxidase subunit IV